MTALTGAVSPTGAFELLVLTVRSAPAAPPYVPCGTIGTTSIPCFSLTMLLCG
jgi:hypothetical protein